MNFSRSKTGLSAVYARCTAPVRANIYSCGSYVKRPWMSNTVCWGAQSYVCTRPTTVLVLLNASLVSEPLRAISPTILTSHLFDGSIQILEAHHCRCSQAFPQSKQRGRCSSRAERLHDRYHQGKRPDVITDNYVGRR